MDIARSFQCTRSRLVVVVCSKKIGQCSIGAGMKRGSDASYSRRLRMLLYEDLSNSCGALPVFLRAFVRSRRRGQDGRGVGQEVSFRSEVNNSKSRSSVFLGLASRSDPGSLVHERGMTVRSRDVGGFGRFRFTPSSTVVKLLPDLSASTLSRVRELI